MEMYEKALGIKRKALGEDHSDVGDTYGNMAIVLQLQGKPDAAMEMYEKALGIQRKALGEDHRSVGDTYYNMALRIWRRRRRWSRRRSARRRRRRAASASRTWCARRARRT